MILLTHSSTAEIFGTVMVSCTPSLWSFWFNIFTKTQLYSTLRSTIWSWTKASQSKTFLPSLKQPHDAGRCPCEKCQRSPGRLHAPLSSEQLVEPALPPHSTIQKHTVITQNVSGEIVDIELQAAKSWKNLSREEW